jgi:hypothetical protein
MQQLLLRIKMQRERTTSTSPPRRLSPVPAILELPKSLASGRTFLQLRLPPSSLPFLHSVLFLLQRLLLPFVSSLRAVLSYVFLFFF